MSLNMIIKEVGLTCELASKHCLSMQISAFIKYGMVGQNTVINIKITNNTAIIPISTKNGSLAFFDISSWVRNSSQVPVEKQKLENT